MQPIQYPLSKQSNLLTNIDRLAEISPAAAAGFQALRVPAREHSTLTEREKQLILLAGFAATRNEGGFRVHTLRCIEEGVSRAEIEQLVLLMLGTSLGLAPTVECLTWLDDELG